MRFLLFVFEFEVFGLVWEVVMSTVAFCCVFDLGVFFLFLSS